MQSYIGVLSREKIRISYKNWKRVPTDVKELIWESFNLTYNVDTTWKKGCLKSANNKWRQYKTHLTRTFILSKLDKPEELNEPPTGYGISKDDWSSFVINRMSDDFIRLSDQQKERRKMNIYPHRLARKGYARFAEEIAAELCDDDEINRAIIWKKGRLNKEGRFEGDDLTERVDKIDAYIQEKQERKLKIEGPKDGILTKALETEEHAGRVRGIGGHITPTIYFNVGRNWKGSDVSTEHKRELMEAKKKISEQDARIKKLEAIMYKNGACDMSIDDKGSCSEKLNQMNESDMKHDDVELQIVSKFDVLQGKQVALTVEGSKNIVAYGTVVCVKGEDKMIHGVPLPHNCIRVSIDEAVDKSTPLLVPIPSECETIGDAVGTLVVWPEHFIVKSNEVHVIFDGKLN
ncbi:uncharacterized protein [Primulina eburnea]|uniref:uncharacterized protein n=1 Tax=Primulina eburnea TaxID=1245227 RepID=UPI003C6C1242